VDDVGVGELVPEEAEARHLGREPIAVGLNLQDLDLEDVAGLGIVDVYRAGQRMDHVEVGRADRLSGGLRAELSVQAVPRLQDNLIARSQRTIGGMSGCQRLWPVSGSSASVFDQSTRTSCVAIGHLLW
jgi:hypothetical protein